jgi:hypothetical protein
MEKKCIKAVAVAAAIFLIPSLARAFTGNLITCNNSAGKVISVTLKPGLNCPPAIFNKLSLKTKLKDGTQIDGCAANPLAPWGTWANPDANGKKWQKKPISVANAVSITQADVALKGVAYGTCNLASPDPAGATASGSLKITFYDALGAKIAKGQAYVTVGADLLTQAAQATGVMTKGLAVGANISVSIGIDITDPVNGPTLACNTGGACPPALPGPITALNLKSAVGNQLLIDY